MLQVRILPGLGYPSAKENMFGKFGGFISETKQELNKVTWPSRSELWQATLVVIFTTAILATFIGSVDFVLSTLMRIVLR